MFPGISTTSFWRSERRMPPGGRRPRRSRSCGRSGLPGPALIRVAPGDNGIDVIAHDNQWLWQAHAVDDPGGRPLARVIDYEAGERFGDIDLGDFLFPMVTATVTGSRFATPRPWVTRPLSGVDPDRLLGTDPIEIAQLGLPHVAVGDGWLYLYRRAAMSHRASAGPPRPSARPSVAG